MGYEKDEVELEDTRLCKLICKGTERSLHDAWRLIGTMSEEDIRLRSHKDRSTYLHHVICVAQEVYKRYDNIALLLPILYRLAMKGVRVNAQNDHGNTCLHLACIKPRAESLCPHLIRVGADPGIQNRHKCRVIHTYYQHKCQLVKGQSTAKSGLWNAVSREDLQTVEKLMKSWCRVNIWKNKSLMSVADETANMKIIKMLHKYERANEVVCAAFAGDAQMVKQLLGKGGVDITQQDEACDVPKPLIIALEEVGEFYISVTRVLKDYGGNGSEHYQENLMMHSHAFEHSEFYKSIEEGTDETLQDALQLLSDNKVDIMLTSQNENTKGWTFLHYVVDRYNRMKEENEERARLLIRAIYRLALAGIDVNVRDANGDTALVKATEKLDQNLMAHIIRIGADSSITDRHGRACNEEVYEDKGKLVFDKKYRIADLPGLWIALDNNNVSKAEKWLNSWARVNIKRGDRTFLDIARSMKRKDLVRVVEQYEHMNEFVCATFASDLKRMMNILALGQGKTKVNTIDEFFHVGFTWDRHAEFMSRPIVVTAMEICTPEVVEFLIHFGANLTKDYEEVAPCGPVAFWAFRDHVSNDNALVVAKHADSSLRDELGATMLHKAIGKKRMDNKLKIVRTLLDRGIEVSARDWEGSTARDCICIYDIVDGDELRQQIDNYVLELVNNEEEFKLEDLLLDGYDHILDIHGTKKNKTAEEIAELKEYKDIITLFSTFRQYRNEINLLHESAKSGDLITISKLAGEKRCAWSRDKAGRSLLHNAVLYQHPDIVKFLNEQYPHLINSRDNRMRTPLHLCVCLKERQLIWPLLQDGGADPCLLDANNMSVYDYVRELETPTPKKERPRGRRWQDYRPSKVIEYERKLRYGAKAASYNLKPILLTAIKKESLSDIKKMTEKFCGDLSINELDVEIMKHCVDYKRQEIAKHLINQCGARSHMSLQVPDAKGIVQTFTLKEYAQRAELLELVEFIDSCPKLEEAQVESVVDVIVDNNKDEHQTHPDSN